MVKSRLFASSCQQSVYCTTACRPLVFISLRRVVISNRTPLKKAVTLPCDSPVALTFIPESSSKLITSSGLCLVATSISEIGNFRIVFLTQPPTKRAESNGLLRTFISVLAGSSIHHLATTLLTIFACFVSCQNKLC